MIYQQARRSLTPTGNLGETLLPLAHAIRECSIRETENLVKFQGAYRTGWQRQSNESASVASERNAALGHDNLKFTGREPDDCLSG